MTQKRKVVILTKDPLLHHYLKNHLSDCEMIELVEPTRQSKAVIMETRAISPTEKN